MIGNSSSGDKKYYIIKVLDNKLVIDKVDEDPSLKVKLSKIEESDPRQDVIYDGRPKRFRVKTDSTGKVQSIQGPAAKAPVMK